MLSREAEIDPATTLSCRLVVAYVSQNVLPREQVARVLTEVHRAIRGLMQPSFAELPGLGFAGPREAARPTVQEIQASISDNGLISFENGRCYQCLKRHLTSLELTPETYRKKWGLPKSYPMVCPSYSARRSDIARGIGLGHVSSRSGAPAAQQKGQNRRATSRARPHASNAHPEPPGD